MDIIEKRLAEIRPFENNPRKNDGAVEYVANSIREFGFKVPIVIDANGVIVCGHTRYKAAQKLGFDAVPCVVADDLTPEQIKAFRLADNKTAETAEWDFDLLGGELEDILNIDMSELGFDMGEPVTEDEESEIDDKTKAPVAVKVTFQNAEHWRKHETELRAFVEGLENVGVVVGEYIED